MLRHKLVFLLIAKSNWFGDIFTTINLILISQLNLTLTGKLMLFLRFQFLRSLPIALDERSFQNLLSLKELHLEYNLIKTINERAFYQIPSIMYLNLSYNLIQDLSRYGFYGLETLETIDLSFNDIRVVDDRVFDNLKWLVHLKLNDNNICKISGKAFKDASSLRSLNLNNNRIYRLQESAFRNIQRNVDTFHVSGILSYRTLTCYYHFVDRKSPKLWLRDKVVKKLGVNPTAECNAWRTSLLLS